MQYLFTQEEYDKIKVDKETFEQRLKEISIELEVKYKKVIQEALNKHKVHYNNLAYSEDLKSLLLTLRTTFDNGVMDLSEYKSPIS